MELQILQESPADFDYVPLYFPVSISFVKKFRFNNFGFLHPSWLVWAGNHATEATKRRGRACIPALNFMLSSWANGPKSTFLSGVPIFSRSSP